jgi:rhamnose transport system substrate-binding protein
MNRLLSHGLTLVGAIGLLATACSPAATGGATTAPAATTAAATTAAPTAAQLNVVFIPKQVNNPYFDVAAKGGQKAATELNGKFSQVGPQAANAAEQVPFIQTATTQKVSAIVISADDKDAIAPALKAAMSAGIKVVGYDSSPAVGAYNVFVNQADTKGIGLGLAQMACDIAPTCTGDIAVLSASATATNQNAWIEAMKGNLSSDAKFKGLKLVDVVYGNDDPTVSTTQAQGLLQKYPNLKVIIAPTTVGIVAAAQVIEQAKNTTTKVTGLGTPKGMQAYVKTGTSPEFALWNVTDLGYLAYQVAAKLVSGQIKGTSGETFSIPSLNNGAPYTIGADSVVILGPPFVFNKDNIDKYVTEFGF